MSDNAAGVVFLKLCDHCCTDSLVVDGLVLNSAMAPGQNSYFVVVAVVVVVVVVVVAFICLVSCSCF